MRVALRRLGAIASAPLAFLYPSPAQGQWVANGIPVCTAAGVQFRPGIAPDGAGGAVIFWVDGRELTHDIYAQRVTSDGTIWPGWPENGVFLATDLGELWSPRGVPDGLGGAIIVWEDHRDFSTSAHNIYAQRVTGGGEIAPGWPAGGLSVCTEPGDQREPRPIADGAGGAIITWYDRRDDTGGPTADPSPDIYALRVTAEGGVAPGWVESGIPVCADPHDQWFPHPAPDGAGGVIVSWMDGRNVDTSLYDIYAQRVTSTGQIATGWTADGNPVCTVSGHQGRTRTVGDGSGGAILIWQDGRKGPDADPEIDLFALRILPDGTPAPGWPEGGVPLCTAPKTQQSLSAGPDGLGGAIVAWDDYRSQVAPGNTGSDIYVQRVTAEGAVPEGWAADGVPLCRASGFQISPELAPDGAGGAFVAWDDIRNGMWREVFAQHVTASGSIAAGWDLDGTPVSAGLNGADDVKVAPAGTGTAILVWRDARNGGMNTDIFAHKLGIDGPVPTRPSLVSAEAEADRVVLSWYAHDVSQAVVERRTIYSGWLELGPAAVEPGSLLRYEDRSVIPGERYGYRLGYWDGGARSFTEETWVEVPTNLQFALHGFSPNPSASTPTVSLTLPTADAARLDVYDLRGRLVLRRDLSSLGPGRHLIPLNTGARLALGVYLLRLTQGDSVAQTRGVVLD